MEIPLIPIKTIILAKRDDNHVFCISIPQAPSIKPIIIKERDNRGNGINRADIDRSIP